MGAYTKYSRFNSAFSTWLRTCTRLVTLTGHTSGSPRIYVKSGAALVPQPSCLVTMQHLGGLVPDVDDGYMRTFVLCEAFSKDRVATLQMIGAVEMHAKQNSTTYALAGFESENIKAYGVTFTGMILSGESTTDDTSGVYVSSCQLEVHWCDKQTA